MTICRPRRRDMPNIALTPSQTLALAAPVRYTPATEFTNLSRFLGAPHALR